MKYLIIAMIPLFFVACSSNKYVVKEVDDKLEVKGQMGDNEIGLNKKGEAIIQTSRDADDELRLQIWKNSELEAELNAAHHDLKRCRTDLADPRLDGSGEVTEIPEIDQIKSIADVKEEMGLTETGSLKVIRREKYVDRLNLERKFGKSLKSTLRIVKKHKEKCERKMAYARMKKGLPEKRYLAQGKLDSKGRWITTRKAEKTLNDAFEIKRKMDTQKIEADNYPTITE